ncbi:hypothetical protein [Staphylococcus chromogenes]|uniref:hypothetical protein n=1 Tax=Staphylococcus chromogenes TaxID=46126 RepID=UPI002DBCEE80|nr:hypothetical protein [Staphylococcus chromogenes]MEB7824807.1 hypothetical protein [Staphylococcus chromogenes]
MSEKQKDILIYAGFLILSTVLSIWSLITESFVTCVLMGIFAIRSLYNVIKTLGQDENT